MPKRRHGLRCALLPLGYLLLGVGPWLVSGGYRLLDWIDHP